MVSALISYLRSKFGPTWWCNVVHNWSKWSSLHHKEIINGETKGVVGTWLVQRRQCSRCDEIQTKSKSEYL